MDVSVTKAAFKFIPKVLIAVLLHGDTLALVLFVVSEAVDKATKSLDQPQDETTILEHGLRN